MEWLTPGNWPIFFICLAMIACAIIDWWKFKVPNVLTFPIIFSGWALGIVHMSPLGNIVAGDGVGWLGDSLAGTLMGLLLMLPVYAIGGMGAGDVKMTMGFGSWVGAYFSVYAGAVSCLSVIWWAWVAGVIAGGIIGVAMIALRRQYAENLQHTRAILSDLATGGSLTTIAEKAHARRPRWHRLPYGVPLCIGFVAYLAWRAFE